MSQKLLLASLVLCLFVFGGTPQAFGQEDRETPTTDSIEKLLSEGWRPVVEGVFQRDRGGSVVESIAFGPEGFAWRIEELRGQLAKMEAEQKAYPSKKLARTIAAQKREIARLQQALDNGEVSSAQSATTQDKVIINGCDVTYGAHADAYYQTSSQGVGASANAHFTNNCGHSGHTEAYAYVRATLNGVLSTHSVFDPKDGNGITSNASWSLQGGPDCYSQASASVNSVSLGVSYAVFDENYECPQVPGPTVTITGPTAVGVLGYNCRTVTWYANVSGGVSPFTYTWWQNGYYVGNGSSYSATFCGDNIAYTETVNLQVDVADALGRGAWDTHVTNINYTRTTTSECYPYKFCPQEPIR